MAQWVSLKQGPANTNHCLCGSTETFPSKLHALLLEGPDCTKSGFLLIYPDTAPKIDILHPTSDSKNPNVYLLPQVKRSLYTVKADKSISLHTNEVFDGNLVLSAEHRRICS